MSRADTIEKVNHAAKNSIQFVWVHIPIVQKLVCCIMW